ncbi:hypothetical protein EV356DRAFT_569843 [Viridothelium virens]|uniref:Thioester reductase (TE) domain-containing protein n=1 Tax=Viridothelium virens TaxID=1048519 RepID=A0A6A6GZ18_VIRVR|nr:hypothetical protein EV356DRAFT_569843 [Viridothelium virens]
MLNQYSQDLRVPTVPSTAPPKQDLIVVVTGTTGTFGSYLLSSLLHSLSISKIYCLNCNENAAASLRAFVQRSPSSNSSFSSLEGKLTYITIDLSKPNLSLPNCSYEALVEDIDLPKHKSAGFVFLSTVSTAEKWRPPTTTFSSSQDNLAPETSHLFGTSASIGYSESKYVAEHLVSSACHKVGVRSAICRVGQIAGPTHNEHDGGDDLEHLERVDWVPADVLGDAVGEMVVSAYIKTQESEMRAIEEEVEGGKDEKTTASSCML